ncbi:MAG TPA: DUF1707 and FHA domain-containing protein [Streptosporangiaceae bacterium]|nr:DUF1707 and FHA domain-containing protein [Streptosporangiaceae bacterium]
MRVSSDRLAAEYGGMRASDAERDQAIGELRDRFIEGRLSQETFLYRMDVALRAKDRAELSGLFADLPPSGGRGPLAPHEPEHIEPTYHEHAHGQPAQGAAGPRRVGRQALDALARAWRAAGRRSGAVMATSPPPLCLPPEAGKRRFTIGRELACDFTLADLSVSRWHARLHREDDNWLLSDLGSTNGTRLNGWRVTTSVRIRPGDRVSFGTVTFVITDRPVGAG